MIRVHDPDRQFLMKSLSTKKLCYRSRIDPIEGTSISGAQSVSYGMRHIAFLTEPPAFSKYIRTRDLEHYSERIYFVARVLRFDGL